MMQILRGIVRWIFARDVIDEVALLAKSERSRSYVTEERVKRQWQDPQKQSDMNFRQALILDESESICFFTFTGCKYGLQTRFCRAPVAVKIKLPVVIEILESFH